ncbi:MAG: protein kinase domain-containing protein, partial [Gemmatimonadota bacterium]
MSELQTELQAALGSAYTLERELGGGGMSRTFVATERALNRRVVVKVLAPELLAGISVERFKREVLLAAALQHPHIVPVLSTGDANGLPWFTMPYVEGDSLRQRLARGPMTLGEITAILRDVARALEFAHGHGVVHRDIKPDNVLLAGSSATVTDFGIAKALTAARTMAPGGTTLTVAGTAIGTPAYMAPEQAAGDNTLDHRADLYAFGAMAYELLAGRPPFVADSQARLIAAHFSESPRDVRELRPDTPAALADVIMRCLAKEAVDRPASAVDLVRVLDSVSSTGGGGVLPEALRGPQMRLGRALGVWGGATALVGVTAWAATRTIGLPDWAFPGAIGVMLAGLPAVLGTWYVQRTSHRVLVSTPTLTPGGSVAPHGTLATIAVKAAPHVSWRRTWMGGAIAAGSFATFIVAFMVLRALGIGPMGSLRGAGAFGDRETLVVADFRPPTGDSTLGATVAEAIRTDLAQSKNLSVMTRAALREALRLMGRAEAQAVEFDAAREIATREGAKAVLDGAIDKLGPSYVVSARLVASLDGSELATFRATAEDDADLIAALGRLSHDVRQKVGESLRDIRQAQSLERVTTSSLPALRKYVEASDVISSLGDTERGQGLLREAVALMNRFKISGVPIVDADGKLVGIITNRDLQFERNVQRPIREVMTATGLVTAPLGTTLDDAERILAEHRIEKLPVVSGDGVLQGLITVKDIQKRRQFPNACKDERGRLRVGA